MDVVVARQKHLHPVANISIIFFFSLEAVPQGAAGVFVFSKQIYDDKSSVKNLLNGRIFLFESEAFPPAAGVFISAETPSPSSAGVLFYLF